jgi:hypothetical protein
MEEGENETISSHRCKCHGALDFDLSKFLNSTRPTVHLDQKKKEKNSMVNIRNGNGKAVLRMKG